MKRLCTLRMIVVLLAIVLLAGAATVLGSARSAKAEFASGNGQGKYQNQIFWLDWNGFSFVNGAQRTFTTPGGLNLVATISDVSGGAVFVGRPESAGAAAMVTAYPDTGVTAITACSTCTNRFRISFTATLGGVPLPVDLVAALAYAAFDDESLRVTSDGSAWRLLEQFRASNLDAVWSNSDKTLLFDSNSSAPRGSALALATGVNNLDFVLKSTGSATAMLGILLPLDYGDASPTFGDASHLVPLSISGGLPGATKSYAPIATTFTQFAAVTANPTLYLGAAKPDVEPRSRNSGPASSEGDDLSGIDDEDGITFGGPLYAIDASYAISATVVNNTGSSARLAAWIDFNRSGAFEAGERRQVAVPAAAGAQTLVLTWTGLSGLPLGPISYRVRLSSAADLSPTGGLTNGEVEDALLRVNAPGSITILKQATPKDGTDFNFTATGQPNFTLDDAVPDDNDGIANSIRLDNLRAGNFTVAEQAPSGWALKRIRCTSNQNRLQAVILPAVNIQLFPGENVTCTFINEQLASLTVIKQASGEDETFNFTSSTLAPNAFALTTISGTAQTTFANLVPGTFDVAESALPATQVAVDATCDNGNAPSAVTLAGGDHVTCTFRNRQENTLIVIKRAVGGDASFPFTATSNLEPTGVVTLATTAGEATQVYPGLVA
ncbi:MAG: CshA/CshB family fibrillar adhesin-related protein, partial [Caldilineaceae bacterium]